MKLRVSKGAAWYGVLALVLVTLGWTVLHMSTQGRQITALSVALSDEQRHAVAEGRPTVAPPPASVIAHPTQVAPEPAPTVDVDAIVAEVLARIPTPRDGHTPTAAEVAAVIVQVCQTRGCPPTPVVTKIVAETLARNPPPSGPPGPTGSPGPTGPGCDPNLNPDCRGPQGPRGEQGPQGETGQQGRPPTAEELDQAVARYEQDHPLNCGDGFTATTVPAPIGEPGGMWQVCASQTGG